MIVFFIFTIKYNNFKLIKLIQNQNQRNIILTKRKLQKFNYE